MAGLLTHQSYDALITAQVQGRTTSFDSDYSDDDDDETRRFRESIARQSFTCEHGPSDIHYIKRLRVCSESEVLWFTHPQFVTLPP